MGVRTIWPEPVPEKSTMYYRCVLTDEKQAPIDPAQVQTLVLTLFDKDTGAIINSVNGTNIKNTDRGLLGVGGVLEITLTPADAVMTTPAKSSEKHIMFYKWTFGPGGVKEGEHEVEFAVTNLLKVS